MSSRTFTLDEAQMLLPVLESLLKQAIQSKKLIEEVDAEVQEITHRIFMNGGMLVNVIHLAQRKAAREKAIRRQSHSSSGSMRPGLSRNLPQRKKAGSAKARSPRLPTKRSRSENRRRATRNSFRSQKRNGLIPALEYLPRGGEP